MSEQVHDISTLPKSSAFKRWSKRAVVTTLVVGAVALIATKLTGSGEDENETAQA